MSVRPALRERGAGNALASTDAPKDEGQTRRHYARVARDRQWTFMERAAALGTLFFSPWNKYRQDEAADELRCSLMAGLDIIQWTEAHPDWFVIGEWIDGREVRPVQLTPAGLAALQNRAEYDLEPYQGGLVDPGWEAIPLPPAPVGADPSTQLEGTEKSE